MSKVFAGSRDGYAWLAGPEREVAVTPDVIRRHHLGMRLAITCFDSGPISATEGELSIGWSMQGKVMVSPPLTEELVLPADQYDEWYVMDEPRFDEVVVEAFVNYCGFTLASPEVLAGSAGERTAANYEFLRPLQERFWRQLRSIAPTTFVGWGDNTVVVSRRPAVIRAAHAA